MLQALTFSVIFNPFWLIMNIWNMKRMQKSIFCSTCSAAGRTATMSFAPSCTPSTFATRSRLNRQRRSPWKRMCRCPSAARQGAQRRLTGMPRAQAGRASPSAAASLRKPGSAVPPRTRLQCFAACRPPTAHFLKRSFSPLPRTSAQTYRSALQAARRSAKGSESA